MIKLWTVNLNSPLLLKGARVLEASAAFATLFFQDRLGSFRNKIYFAPDFDIFSETYIVPDHIFQTHLK
jgi:hypothetical protein